LSRKHIADLRTYSTRYTYGCWSWRRKEATILGKESFTAQIWGEKEIGA